MTIWSKGRGRPIQKRHLNKHKQFSVGHSSTVLFPLLPFKLWELINYEMKVCVISEKNTKNTENGGYGHD